LVSRSAIDFRGVLVRHRTQRVLAILGGTYSEGRDPRACHRPKSGHSAKSVWKQGPRFAPLEDLRAYAIEPKALELKVAQMIMFAILLNNQTASGA
jgi:hypothetical protein